MTSRRTILNLASIILVCSLLIFKNSLIDLLEIIVTPITKNYSRAVSIDKAVSTLINFVAIYISSFLILFNFKARFIGGFKKLLIDYASPINLSVFRILTFSVALLYYSFNEGLNLSKLSADSIVPPFGMEIILRILPPNEILFYVLSAVFITSTILSILGFKTKVSTIVSTLTGIYVLGLPNFYGKVNHYNHVLWFMMILSLSPCSDVLSIDAKNKNVPQENFKYSIPLLISWFLMGLMYFFPGAWKLSYSGFEWIFSDNLKYVLIEKYIESGLQPIIPRIESQFYFWSVGLFTVIFELIFIFLIFIPRWRILAIMAGILFHLGVFLQMRINFIGLVVFYLIFINWGKFKNYKKFTSDIDLRLRDFSRLHLSIVSIVFILGGLGVIHGWPFSCYPAFATVKTNFISSVKLKWETKNHIENIDLEKIKERIGSDRLWTLMDLRNKKHKENLERVALVVKDLYQINTGSLKFYKETKDVMNYPEIKIVNEELVHSFKLD